MVVPAKVVGRIQKGEFVDMGELLSDNIKLAEKSPDTSSSADGVAKHMQVRKRELQEDVKGLFSWVEAFNMFSCILVGQHPELVKPLAAYQTLIIREARRFNYRGWLQYDQLFRQHSAVGVCDTQSHKLCFSWNDGRCARSPNCNFHHACYRCEGGTRHLSAR